MFKIQNEEDKKLAIEKLKAFNLGGKSYTISIEELRTYDQLKHIHYLRDQISKIAEVQVSDVEEYIKTEFLSPRFNDSFSWVSKAELDIIIKKTLSWASEMGWDIKSKKGYNLGE